MTPLGIVAIAVLVLPILAVLGSLVIWWVQNVGRHRIPRPFLGEGPNVEWAEKKRAELAAANLGREPAKSHSAGSSPDPTDELEFDPVLHADRSGENGRDAASHLPQRPVEGHEELLQAWLDETGHADDEWAEKIFNDREKSE